jgi:DNA-binding protein
MDVKLRPAIKVKICSFKRTMLRGLLSEAELGLAALYRIIKKSGAERVSDEAADELRRAVEEVATHIAKQAVELAEHAGRHTVKGVDVKLAVKNVLRT